MAKITKKDALNYHSEGRSGKIEVVPTKPTSSQRDLSLAYSPGVAEPCLEIQKDADLAYKYTAKGNLVAVISNGTAVLGLGDIGAIAGKPVMEGKGVLFKIFADIDVFDIEIDEPDPERFIQAVKAISPTFGGINLEDIKAPECFEIERRLKAELSIPVMHDDQHGTAIISSAGLLNALEIMGKKIEEVQIVVNGAGAAAMACTRLYISLGAKRENIVMLDSKGVLNHKRGKLGKFKEEFVTHRDIDTLEDAMKNCDVFLGLSVADVVTVPMVQSMAPNAIVFALANPNPEIAYDLALASREDIIIATGRSDNPNQINNVLGFPFIFRGALDVKATEINEAMKIAAVKAIAELARKDVPDEVIQAYQLENLTFGKSYIIPKPLDPRLLTTVAPAVAKAAIESRVARYAITDWQKYTAGLSQRMGRDNKLVRYIHSKAKQNPKRVVFAEAEHYNVLKAAQVVLHEGIAIPILLGDKTTILSMIEKHELDMPDVLIIDPRSEENNDARMRYAKQLCKKRNRKGMAYNSACERMLEKKYFGVMMVENGDADALISGVTETYPDSIRPAIQAIGVKEGSSLAGMHIMMTKNGPIFLADTTVNFDPTTQTIVNTTLLVAEQIKKFNIEPIIAMLSYSNFGSVRSDNPMRVSEAVAVLHKQHPDLIVDGEIQANFALNSALHNQRFPFSKLNGKNVNTLIFPNLSSGNIAYKMLQEMAGMEAIGPILLGLNKPVHIVGLESSVREIVNMTAIAVIDANNVEAQK